MAQIVRQSKFRHVYCTPVKHENCMSDIKVTEITWDSLFCDVNPKFIAFINKGAGGPFLVIPVNKIGRIDKDYPFVDAHRAPTLEVWVIPDKGLSRTLHEPAVELNGHQKRVNTMAWHPTANNLLLTAGGENLLLLWNVGNGEALLEIAGHPDQIFSVAFNYDGSQFVTTCKDKKIRILDTHTGSVVHEGVGHEGLKPQRAVFIRDGRIFTTGFTKRSERLYALRAPDNLSSPIIEEELDTSNGVLFPMYDEDTGLMFLVAKGDCAIRYYEINNEYPFVHYINTYTTSEPQRALGSIGKRGISSTENEVVRLYKLTTKGIVDILQFFVPRKSELFQHDLYPDTRSTAPALTAEEFMEGKNAAPKLQPVNPAAAQAKPKLNVAKKANILAQLPTQIETTQQTSYAEKPQQERQASRPTSQATSRPASSAQSSPRKPVIDDDMGIVAMGGSSGSRSGASSRQEAPKENKPDPMKPKEQGRHADVDELPAAAPNRVSASPRMSVSSSSGEIGRMPTNMDELLEDLQKMKTVIRQHERRIRMLEETLADANMSSAYSF
ncbi:hypothetical protein WR25_08933 [Diploscapter pachys]|uniref:Coronin n=1 Tax=Diploscapter pachys TaxID=2018661 RepID=A0A2A2LSZ7_9BILA|nr:hypothetical protein WR25_08933 [Diploscapter pachys]